MLLTLVQDREGWSRVSRVPTVGAMFRDTSSWAGFSWHTKDAACLCKCMVVFRAELASKTKRAIAWDKTKILEDGIFLAWRDQATYFTAYKWFARVLAGKLEESEW